MKGTGRTLLEGASFTLAYGHRYGVVGRNGTGKSTLLKRIAERDGINISEYANKKKTGRRGDREEAKRCRGG